MANDLIWSQVREACDIVEIIGQHVALRRAGKEFKGLCPFHPDHRPSMSVVPQKQIFHCFVCGTGGDVFKFIELFHKMSKGETLRFLAQKTGIKLPELNPAAAARSAEKRSERETLTETNERACDYFQKLLRAKGNPGIDYLHRRGLTDETIDAFRLGWSLPKNVTWTGLCDASMRLGFSPDILVAAGLAKKRTDGSPYDVFRGRVIFPITEGTGGNKIIAFGGRVLEEVRDAEGNVIEAKYLNSPETPVFAKSETLYGLDRAKQQIIKTQTAVVVEGYMDVIACHQAGVTNVVATLGTALTLEHARILKRFCGTVVLLFDSDDAGLRAANRALETFVREPIDVKIASVPDGKDPCDFCTTRGGGPEAGAEFQKVIDSAVDMLDYQWTRLQKQFQTHTGLSARSEAAREFMRFVAQGMEGAGRNMDPIRRGMLLSKIGKMVGLGVAEVASELTKAARAAAPTPPTHPNANETVGESAPAPAPFNATKLLGLDAAEAWVLGSLLADPKLYDVVREEFSLSLFSPTALQNLAGSLIEYLESANELSACSLADFISTLENQAIVNQAIQLESLSSEWLNPSNLSPAIEKVVRNQQSDMGRTLARRLTESLQELIHVRGDHGESSEALTEESPSDGTAELAKLIAKAQDRNKKGGNQRIIGRGSI